MYLPGAFRQLISMGISNCSIPPGGAGKAGKWLCICLYRRNDSAILPVPKGGMRITTCQRLLNHAGQSRSRYQSTWPGYHHEIRALLESCRGIFKRHSLPWERYPSHAIPMGISNCSIPSGGAGKVGKWLCICMYRRNDSAILPVPKGGMRITIS